MPNIPDIAIIGPGKVGTALGMLAARAAVRIVAVGGRHTAMTHAAAARIGPRIWDCSVHEAAASGKLILLTVSDDAIESICNELAEAKVFPKGSIVAHCSGVLGSEVLGSARDRCRCKIGSMHPLQTFPDVDAAVARLPGAYCFCEGDEEAVTVLSALANRIGGRVVVTDSDHKALYHAAATVACNYVTTLLDASVTLMDRAGIDRQTAMEALSPLLGATVANNLTLGPEQALTGPIARGDTATVARHLEAMGGLDPLTGDDKLLTLYKAAGLATVNLALRKGTIDSAKATALRELLNR